MDEVDFNFKIKGTKMNEATEILRDLFEVIDLGDFIYDIRDGELLGWEGPKVKKWDNAVQRAKKLLSEATDDSCRVAE